MSHDDLIHALGAYLPDVTDRSCDDAQTALEAVAAELARLTGLLGRAPSLRVGVPRDAPVAPGYEAQVLLRSSLDGDGRFEVVRVYRPPAMYGTLPGGRRVPYAIQLGPDCPPSMYLGVDGTWHMETEGEPPRWPVLEAIERAETVCLRGDA